MKRACMAMRRLEFGYANGVSGRCMPHADRPVAIFGNRADYIFGRQSGWRQATPNQLDNPRVSFETAASRLPHSKKSAFPAKAGIHLSGDGVVEKWIPAFAGNADFFGTQRITEISFGEVVVGDPHTQF